MAPPLAHGRRSHPDPGRSRCRDRLCPSSFGPGMRLRALGEGRGWRLVGGGAVLSSRLLFLCGWLEGGRGEGGSSGSLWAGRSDLLVFPPARIVPPLPVQGRPKLRCFAAAGTSRWEYCGGTGRERGRWERGGREGGSDGDAWKEDRPDLREAIMKSIVERHEKPEGPFPRPQHTARRNGMRTRPWPRRSSAVPSPIPHTGGEGFVSLLCWWLRTAARQPMATLDCGPESPARPLLLLTHVTALSAGARLVGWNPSHLRRLGN